MSDCSRRRTSFPWTPSRSRIRYRGTVRSRKASTICCCHPVGRGMVRDIEVQHLPAAMLQHEEYKQDLQPYRRKRKRNRPTQSHPMVFQKRLPTLGWRSQCGVEDARDRALGDDQTQHLQLPMDSRRPPQRIGRCHLKDQSSNLFGNPRTSATRGLRAGTAEPRIVGIDLVASERRCPVGRIPGRLAGLPTHVTADPNCSRNEVWLLTTPAFGAGYSATPRN